MYGLNMGIGFNEVLSQNYDVDATGEWRYAAAYDYTNSGVEGTISTIWSSTYNAIANLNIMIRNIDKADSTMFSENHYYTYRGEAYGMRGFLHFDLMRLFMRTGNGQQRQGRALRNRIQHQRGGAEDRRRDHAAHSQRLARGTRLLEARLAQDWLVAILRTLQPHSILQLLCRHPHLARAYMWMGDKQNALKYANEIIDIAEGDLNSKPFSWVHYTTMQSSKMNEVDMAFTAEQIFYLTMKDWEDTADKYFTSAWHECHNPIRYQGARHLRSVKGLRQRLSLPERL